MADIITVDILDNGDLRITTDQISAGNHRNADDLLKTLEALAGGKTTIKKRHGHRHQHGHEHTHTHHKH